MTRPPPHTVLITGASGFLGQHAAAALLERGATVRALVRRPDATVPPGVTRMAAGGLDDVRRVRAAVAGADAVVHLAAQVHQEGAGIEANRRVNVEGTRVLLEEAERAGVASFVFTSSVKAVGEETSEPWTEATSPAPLDPYGATKLEAEELVRAAGARGMHAPVLRLPLVYGPGMKANALRLFDLVMRGVPLPLGAVRNRRSLLFTGNFVAALLAALESPRASQTFFVSDDEDLSTPELIRRIARALGRPARLVPVPVGVLRAIGRAGDLLGQRFPLTTAAVDRLAGSLAVSPARLMSETGYRPPFSVTEGLRITAEWYRARSPERR